MQLTENFSLKEMLASQAAIRLNFSEQYEPGEDVVHNLRQLCVHVLQPLRQKLNRSIHVSSGYRCLRVNQAIGGVTHSQHLKGQATDIVASNLSIDDLYLTIKNSNLPYDQLIHEFNRWIHVSYDPTMNRRESLRAVRQKVQVRYVRD